MCLLHFTTHFPKYKYATLASVPCESLGEIWKLEFYNLRQTVDTSYWLLLAVL